MNIKLPLLLAMMMLLSGFTMSAQGEEDDDTESLGETSHKAVYKKNAVLFFE